MATASNTVKGPVVGAPPYQLTLEDRLRWAQIADVMAQANHYAVSLFTVIHTNKVHTNAQFCSTIYSYTFNIPLNCIYVFDAATYKLLYHHCFINFKTMGLLLTETG